MKLAFALMAAINAGFTKTEARRASWRPRSDSRFSLADSESGAAAIRPAWATMGKPGRSTTDSRFDPIVCSQAASNRSDACSDSALKRSPRGEAGSTAGEAKRVSSSARLEAHLPHPRERSGRHGRPGPLLARTVTYGRLGTRPAPRMTARSRFADFRFTRRLSPKRAPVRR